MHEVALGQLKSGSFISFHFIKIKPLQMTTCWGSRWQASVWCSSITEGLK